MTTDNRRSLLGAHFERIVLRAFGIVDDPHDVIADVMEAGKRTTRRRLIVVAAMFWMWTLAIQIRLAQVFASPMRTAEHLPIPIAARVGMMLCIPTIVLTAYTIKRASVFVYGVVEIIVGAIAAWYATGTLTTDRALAGWAIVGGSILLVNRGLLNCVDDWRNQESGESPD